MREGGGGFGCFHTTTAAPLQCPVRLLPSHPIPDLPPPPLSFHAAVTTTQHSMSNGPDEIGGMSSRGK
jgi:hypothetical protein